jgi:hypothetical protein
MAQDWKRVGEIRQSLQGLYPQGHIEPGKLRGMKMGGFEAGHVEVKTRGDTE